MKGNLDAQKEKEKLSRLGKYEMTQKHLFHMKKD